MNTNIFKYFSPDDPKATLKSDLHPSRSKGQRSSLFVSLWSKATSLMPSREVSRGRARKNSDGIIAPRSRSRPPSPLLPNSPLMSPGFMPASSPGMGSNSLMPPQSPLHSPVGSPISTSFDAGSWVPVDGVSRPPSRSSTPNDLAKEVYGARKRINLQTPPPRRTTSHTT